MSGSIDWIRGCDVLIAEVSVPSHGVGYEIGFVLDAGNPVLCLSQEGRKVSKLISVNPNPNLQAERYQDIAKAIELAGKFLKSIK